MKYFFDTEFIDDGRTIDLISIGIVDQNGREFYQISSEFDASKASEWVRTHVLNHLPNIYEGIDRSHLGLRVAEFVGEDPKPEFWAFNGAYDWVVVCQLYGPMIQRPKNLPRFYHEIKQLPGYMGKRFLPKSKGTKHRAIDDAIWVRDAYQYLTGDVFTN